MHQGFGGLFGAVCRYMCGHRLAVVVEQHGIRSTGQGRQQRLVIHPATQGQHDVPVIRRCRNYLYPRALKGPAQALSRRHAPYLDVAGTQDHADRLAGCVSGLLQNLVAPLTQIDGT